MTGEGEETVHPEGVQGAPWEEQRMVGIWRKPSDGDPKQGKRQ